MSLEGTTASFVDSTSVTTTACEGCGEDPLVTAVSDHTATAVTGVTLTPTTEECLMPLICTDEYGNFQQVVRSTDRDDTTTTRESHGVIRFGNTIDGE